MKTTFFTSQLGSLLAAIWLAVIAQTVSAATISLKVEAIEGSGPTVEVPISAVTCEGMGALQFDLSYDPSVVEVESVETGGALTGGMVESEVKSPGLLGVALISGTPIDGTGELLKVQFKLVAATGGTSSLAITHESAWDYKNNLEMTVTSENGSLSLVPGAPWVGLLDRFGMGSLIVIGAIVLLALIILSVAKQKRKSPKGFVSASASASGSQSNGGFCEKCGNSYHQGARFCPKCGQPVEPST